MPARRGKGFAACAHDAACTTDSDSLQVAAKQLERSKANAKASKSKKTEADLLPKSLVQELNATKRMAEQTINTKLTELLGIKYPILLAGRIVAFFSRIRV